MAIPEAVLQRKEELKERFAEHIDDPSVDAAVGLSLVGAGLGTAIVNLVRGKRGRWSYVLPAIFILGGVAVVSAGALSRRSSRIMGAEEVVRAQLAGLDPIARAQVLRDVAGETFTSLINHDTD